MNEGTSPDRLFKQPGESLLLYMDFTKRLNTGETLTGTPTITSAEEFPNAGGATDLTISSPAVTSSAITTNYGTIAVGKGVQFRVVGGTDGKTYRIQVSCATSASNTRIYDGLLDVGEK